MSYFLKHNWGYVFLLPFIFLAFARLASFGFQQNNDNYNISYSHIRGTVIATEKTSYGTKVILDNGFVTLRAETELLIGRTYDFSYKNYTLKVDNWWTHFIGIKDSVLIGFCLQ